LRFALSHVCSFDERSGVTTRALSMGTEKKAS
jgi:hypothetical protein